MTDQALRGRLFVVTGAQAAARSTVAEALAGRFDHAVAVDAGIFEHLVVAGRDPYEDPPTSEQLRQLYLRWSASIATAETYLLEGFEAVITDDLRGGHLEDFLDLAAPQPVHLVVLDDGDDTDTPRWGLWISAAESPEAVAEEVLARLAEAVVETAPG